MHDRIENSPRRGRVKGSEMKLKSILLATVGLGLLAAPAFAQDEAGDEEIVVTAQKREQNVQDVPVAVSVVTAQALQATGGTQFSDLTKISPGLTINTGDQPGNNTILVRGVGTFAFSIGVEPSVLTVIDDVPVTLQAQSFQDLADL
jgi:iron complex outermembrane recepter protein